MATRTTSPGALSQDVGWVLANAREHAHDPAVRTAAGFARGGRLPEVHRSQVGRWESGHTPPSYEVVRRYEETLGLPRGQLSAAIEIFARGEAPMRSTAHLTRPSTPGWVDDALELVEKAVSDELMTGIEWDDLSVLLGGHTDAILRRVDWERLLVRSSTQMTVATGLEFALVSESVARLAAHPRSGAIVADMARRSLTDRSTQVFDAVTLVQFTSDPAGVDVLVEALEDPDAREVAVWTALYTLTSLAAARALDRGQRTRAGIRALDLLRAEAAPIRLQRSAAAFLRAIDPPTRDQMVQALRAGSRVRIARILDEGSILADSEASTISRQIATRLVSRLGPHSRWAPSLQRLVRTVTSVTHDEERGTALGILMLSPQGPVVGSAFAGELATFVADGQSLLADDTLLVLSWLLPHDDVPLLLDVALDPRVEPVGAMQAAIAVGNARLDDTTAVPTPQGSSVTARDVVRRVTAAAERSIDEGGAGAAATARGLGYVLGMYGCFERIDRLARVAGHHGRTEWVDTLRWWQELPGWARPPERGA